MDEYKNVLAFFYIEDVQTSFIAPSFMCTFGAQTAQTARLICFTLLMCIESVKRCGVGAQISSLPSCTPIRLLCNTPSAYCKEAVWGYRREEKMLPPPCAFSLNAGLCIPSVQKYKVHLPFHLLCEFEKATSPFYFFIY